jgi:hypothetical protein
MIADQDEYLRDRLKAIQLLKAGDVSGFRDFAVRYYEDQLLKLSDAELLKSVDQMPLWG